MNEKPIYLFSLSSHPDTLNVKSLDVALLHPKINFSDFDYLIITSKQAIESLKYYNSSEFLSKKALLISKNSAKAFQELGGELLEIGEGYGSSLSAIIKLYPKHTRWLYLRAKKVASDFALECREEGYNIDEAILYETQCSREIQSIQVPSDATLIFTSPSSVECFLKTHSIKKTNRVIVIGLTTASRLPKGIEYTISSETTIENCINLAK